MAHTPTQRSALAPSRADPLPSGARFEAPLAQSPYPLASPFETCLDTRDLDMDDGLQPYGHRKE